MTGVGFGAIADDLTGACDAGVQCASRGIPTLVWLLPEAPEIPDLVVLVSRGRSLAAEEARRAPAARCAELVRAQRSLVFEKIDSTFRDNPDVELAAAMEVCGYRLAVLGPAFPAMGRTVEGGWLRLRGQQDAIHLPTRLRREGLLDVLEIPRERFETLLELRPRLPAVAVADAAAVVLSALSVQGVRLGSEIRTGIPWGRLAGGPLDGSPVATKAGGSGEPDALLAAGPPSPMCGRPSRCAFPVKLRRWLPRR